MRFVKHAFGGILFLAIALTSIPRSEANIEFRQIAGFFSIALDPETTYSQQPYLGKAYASYFRKTGDIDYKTGFRFGRDNPSLVVPLRNYLQKLVDDGFIPQAQALNALRGAVTGAVQTHSSAKDTRPVGEHETSPPLSQNFITEQPLQPDTLHERVSALEIQTSASRSELIDRQSAIDNKMTDFGLAISGRLTDIESSIRRFGELLDQKLSKDDHQQFENELLNLVTQIDQLRLEADQRSVATQSAIDGAVLEVLSQVNRMSTQNKLREEEFLKNELRLLRDNSDLRVRIEKLEKRAKPATEASAPMAQSPSVNLQTVLPEQPALDEYNPQKELTVEPPESQLILESEKVSGIESSAYVSPEAEPVENIDVTPDKFAVVEFGFGTALQKTKQENLTLTSILPSVSAKVTGRNANVFSVFELNAFDGRSSLDSKGGSLSFDSSGYEATLSGGYAQGTFDQSTLDGRETRFGAGWSYAQFRSDGQSTAESDQSFMFFDHASGDHELAFRHELVSSINLNDYISYLLSTLIPLPEGQLGGSHVSLGLGWMKDKANNSVSRGLNIEYVKVLDN